MKKTLITVLSVLLLLSLVGTVACQAIPELPDGGNGSGGIKSNPQQLQLLDGSFTYSQEQKLSKIKAENLIKNNGYKDSDEVTVIVSLDGTALIDDYLSSGYGYAGVADYVTCDVGATKKIAIADSQDALVYKMKSKGLIQEVVGVYSTLLNAVAVKTTYGKVAELEKLAGVKKVMLTDTYNKPQTASTSGSGYSAVENLVDVWEDTGIYKSDSVSYTGKNTAVAVLDSGFDCSHEVFQRVYSDKSELAITEDLIAELLRKTALQNVKDNDNDGKYVYNEDGTIKQQVLPLLNAAKFTEGVSVSDLHYSDKIPFVYDYADKDTNVFPYDSEHGTHVAGIIGGVEVAGTQIKDEKPVDFRGVAIDTQLVLMKVFPDLDSGANTADILLALEDAVELGVDAINMSLGSSCGFSREVDKVEINDVYDKIQQSGIALVTAASNSYSSGFGGDQGNTNFTTNPDSGTVGSPSTYDAALSVASISGVKSNYIVANDSYTFFYNQSNSITGDQNDFVKELTELVNKNGGSWSDGESKTFEYVTVPGTGSAGSFAMVGSSLKGKIALVKRGDNTFENKAMLAKNYGAIGCIIYNNVDGDILMSMGKTEHIPTISISKDDGTELAKQRTGTLTICSGNLAGPFMSDFSSWGPTPDLKIKPEITAHGGEIYSSVPNGGYDRLSGTSMASPNLCGIVVLIRDYVKSNADKFGITVENGKPNAVQVNNAVNQLLMSTATIALNEEGNPYSPRKQGAGLASAKNVVATNAYITVNEKDENGNTVVKTKSKLELGHDPQRTGVYEMEFNVVNVGSSALTYNADIVGMTESVSTSDNKHVAEKGNLLDGTTQLEVIGGEGSVNGNKITVPAGKTVTVKATYKLSQADKDMIDSLFKYGMYVEGYVELTAEGQVSLNVPFLAFYGNWAEAPLFDKTYYEVESTAHDKSVDDDDKIKADYWATTPYGSYYYNYMIPLGTYLYDVDSDYDEIPASTDHIAVSNILGTVDGISAVYAGLLRNAKEMKFSITDKTTGETVWTETYYNCHKAFSNGGSPVPYYEFIKVKSLTVGLLNNRQYTFKMQGLLDFEDDNGLTTNVRNSFGFDFYMDDQAPVIKDATYEKVYDKSADKDRYYVNLTVYDNHYAMSVAPVIFTSSSTYTYLTDNPIPIYSERNSDTTVRIEITDYMDELFSDAIINNALAFVVDDYALNSNIYLCQLPGTDGEFKFTSNGEEDGADKILMSMYEGEAVDITKYLYTTDQTFNKDEVELDRTYLKYLTWSSSNEEVLTVNGGVVNALKAGKATVTVKEKLNGASAVMIVNVKSVSGDNGRDDDLSDDKLEKLRFTYYDTLFAYSRAAQTSEIGSTGDRRYVAAQSGLGMYPGESVDMHYEFTPWYVESKYSDRMIWESDNPEIAKVEVVENEDGTVQHVITALKEGVAQITLRVDGTSFEETITVTVKSEFVIENRTLVAYKGLGGHVVIPDDEGILYIGSYAFCLYTTDNTIELPDDDYDANKIPSSNTSVTSVVIPEGVTEIQKYAFYNCTDLREVAIPDEVKYIREYAFYGCKKLERVVKLDNLVKTGSTVMNEKYELTPEVPAEGNAERIPAKFKFNDNVVPESLADTSVEVIGAFAFYNCFVLDDVDLSHVYAIGIRAFDGCKSLSKVNLVSLRNTGRGAFQNCTSLTTAEFDTAGNTQLANGMFYRSGLTEVDIYSKEIIPYGCFSECKNLVKVTVHGDCPGFGNNSFSQCDKLSEVVIEGKLDTIGTQAFYKDKALTSFTLPDGKVSIGDHAFFRSGLTTLTLQANTEFDQVVGSAFRKSNITNFVTAGSKYAVNEQGFLTTADGSEILFAPSSASGKLVVPASVTKIGNSAFSGTSVTEVTFEGKVSVGDYAFFNCPKLTTVTFSAASKGSEIGGYAFAYSLESDAITSEKENESVSALTTLNGLEFVSNAGDYAFAYTAITNKLTTAEKSVYGEGVFFNASTFTEIELGANSEYGIGAFQGATKLKKVIMPDADVTFGRGCFAYDTALNDIDLSLVTTIPALGFLGCTALQSVDLSSAIEVQEYAFSDCPNITKIALKVVKTIGECAFGGNTLSGVGVTEITLPETLETIGAGAFISCTSLESITIPYNVTTVPVAAFALCTRLTSVVLNDVTEIQYNAFKGCTALADIDLKNVTKIGAEAFRGTTALGAATTTDVNGKELNLDSLTDLDEGAFYQSSLAGGVYAPELKNIGDYAFGYSALSFIDAPNVETIGEGAFNEATSLKSYSFGRKLKKVDSFAFLGCSSLSNFYFNNSTSGAINDYAKLVDGVLYTKLANGFWQLASIPAAMDIDTLTVEEGTRRVDAFAANQNTHITTIDLPVSMRNIGQYAFYGCTSLTTVRFRSIEAPSLDDGYNSTAELTEEDPGYETWNKYYNMFGYYLYYYNFVDLVGKVAKLNMIVPANEDIKGYDALPYKMYFGEIEAREGEAMSIEMRDFLDQAVEIAAITQITLGDGDLIDSAVYNYSLVTQSPTAFGISDAEWYNYVDIVMNAKEEVTALRYAKADDATKNVQALIDALPTTFDVSCLEQLKTVSKALKSLTSDQKSALTTTKYDNLVSAYTQYIKQVSELAELLKPSSGNSGKADATASLSGMMLAACLLPALKKRKED